jgi:hypothetical protein
MKLLGRLLACFGIFLACFSDAHAVPIFGAKASGSDLDTPGIQTDGGPGSPNASINQFDFRADASFPPIVTYLPELTAFSQNASQSNDDDITNATAEAYQVFRSSTSQTIDLNVSLHSIINGDAFALADVFVYGGSDFEVFDSPICSDSSLGKFLFDGTYFCGSRLDRSNLFINSGDVTLPDLLSFDVSAGAEFGVYAILRAGSKAGSADATQTLSIEFSDDEFISVVETPVPEPGTLCLLAIGLAALGHHARFARILPSNAYAPSRM